MAPNSQQPYHGTSSALMQPLLVRSVGARIGRKGRLLCVGDATAKTGPAAVPSLIRKGLMNPRQLLSSAQEQATVWTLRFVTAQRRGSQLTEPSAGVQICLVGQTGDAVLHRVSAYHDPDTSESELMAICKAAGKQLGPSCSSSALEALARRSRERSEQRQQTRFQQLRFQEGAVDEVSFLGAELGPLASLLVGPEAGSWFMEEVTVASSRSKHTDRFICRYPLGNERGQGGSSAAFLSPVPQGHVVYGSGASARVVSQMEARILHAAGMKGYLHLKANLLSATASLVAGGSMGAYLMDGWHSAVPFALGGLGGVGYQWMLQQGVDSVAASVLTGRGPYGQGYAPGALLRRMTSTPASLLMFGIALVLGIWAVSDNFEALQSSSLNMGTDGLHHVMMTALGFLMFKLAVVGVAIMPVSTRLPQLDKKAS